MAEILLVRHCQSDAYKRNFAAFGNEESPLTEKGRTVQADELRAKLIDRVMDPAVYPRRVMASTLRRTKETATCVGFSEDAIDVRPEINESNVEGEILSGINVIQKHTQEGWVPEETKKRAERFIGLIRSGSFDYEIYFTHGLFIASVLTVLDSPDHYFDEKRGYIPLQASITPVSI
ncbi:histidine phosphatase family protein [Candidatus Saccharibacteria bacterium]|nr:histidine phosphatase family protein [Candidatus Saccharibacteria bacterium]